MKFSELNGNYYKKVIWHFYVNAEVVISANVELEHLKLYVKGKWCRVVCFVYDIWSRVSFMVKIMIDLKLEGFTFKDEEMTKPNKNVLM